MLKTITNQLEKSGLSVWKLSKDADVQQTRLTRFLQGKSNIQFDALVRILNVLELEIKHKSFEYTDKDMDDAYDKGIIDGERKQPKNNQ